MGPRISEAPRFRREQPRTSAPSSTVAENVSRTSCPRKREAKMASPRAGARARDTTDSGLYTHSEDIQRPMASMDILYIHNDYALPSGEEHAAEKIAGVLRSRGHHVEWFRRASADLVGSTAGRLKAFFCGIHNPASAAALDTRLSTLRPDLVLVQNIYPLISPSIFPVLRRWGVPVVMRCPNSRLFCPNGRPLGRGRLCDRCLGPGREMWCVLRNSQGDFFK